MAHEVPKMNTCEAVKHHNSGLVLEITGKIRGNQPICSRVGAFGGEFDRCVVRMPPLRMI